MAAANKIESHSKYVRHRPEQSLLYRTVQTYWPMFLREQARVGKTIPKFVKQEFDEFLKCGIPEFGVVRTYCFQCRYSGVVAFSCKRRGFCPSCCARRMNDEAAHLVDKVLPQITYRQWVISFPYKLRYQMRKGTGRNCYVKPELAEIEILKDRDLMRQLVYYFSSEDKSNVHRHSGPSGSGDILCGFATPKAALPLLKQGLLIPYRDRMATLVQSLFPDCANKVPPDNDWRTHFKKERRISYFNYLLC